MGYRAHLSTVPLSQQIRGAARMLRHATHAVFEAKFDPNQPRIPAGNPDGGQWTGEGGSPRSGSSSAGASRVPSRAQSQTDDDPPVVSWRRVRREALVDGSGDLTLHEASDGTKIVTERRTGLVTGASASRHIVQMPDGGSLLVDNDRYGVQRIYDADGALISASRWGPNGPEPVAVVQPAHDLTLRVPRALEDAVDKVVLSYRLGIALFGQMAQDVLHGQPVISFRAQEFQPASDGSYSLEFVGEITTDQADQVCVKYPEVRAELTRVASELRAGFRGSPQQFGTAVHLRMKEYVNSKEDDNFVAEQSFDLEEGRPRYGKKGTSRLDILEQISDHTICVYDHKAGKAGISDSQMRKIGSVVAKKFHRAKRFIIIEVRPGF